MTLVLIVAALAVGFVLVPPAAARAAGPTAAASSETARPAPRWDAGLLYEFQSFSGDREQWHAYRLAVRRRFALGSVGLEVLRAHRFDDEDEAVALDVIIGPWRGAYANVRFQATVDPDVLPRTDAMVELFQGLGAGWEVSGGYRNIDVPESTVHVVTAGIAKYVGDWYLRQRTSFAETEGDLSVFFGAAARRYFRVPDDWIQIEGGIGREVIDVAPGPTVQSRRVSAAGVRVQKFFTSRFGLTAAAAYRDERRGPVGLGVSIELLTRW
jgi:YaiO family outer membrane protein